MLRWDAAEVLLATMSFCWKRDVVAAGAGRSIAMGEDLSTGGRVAQGDFGCAGGAGGLATKVGFSDAPFSNKPLPDPSTPGLGAEGAGATVGVLSRCDSVDDGTAGRVAGDAVADDARPSVGPGTGWVAVSSTTWGMVIFVPSVQVRFSGAQSWSSSSISAQLFAVPWPSVVWRRLAMWMPWFLSSSSVNFFGSTGGIARYQSFH